jgi:hypothetical protein
LTNNRPKNTSFLLIKNKINDITSFSTDGIDDILGIIGIREETEEVNSHNIINNIISKINIFFFLIKIIY